MKTVKATIQAEVNKEKIDTRDATDIIRALNSFSKYPRQTSISIIGEYLDFLKAQGED